MITPVGDTNDNNQSQAGKDDDRFFGVLVLGHGVFREKMFFLELFGIRINHPYESLNGINSTN